MYSKIFSICVLLAITEAVKIKVDVRIQIFTIYFMFFQEKSFNLISLFYYSCKHVFGSKIKTEIYLLLFFNLGIWIYREGEEEEGRTRSLENSRSCRPRLSTLSRISTNKFWLRCNACSSWHLRKCWNRLSSEFEIELSFFHSTNSSRNEKKKKGWKEKEFRFCIKKIDKHRSYECRERDNLLYRV